MTAQIKAVLMKPIRNFVMKQSTHEEKRKSVDTLLWEQWSDAYGKDIMWDSGASHTLLPGGELGILPKTAWYEGDIVYLGLAAGRKHKAYSLWGLHLLYHYYRSDFAGGAVVEETGPYMYNHG